MKLHVSIQNDLHYTIEPQLLQKAARTVLNNHDVQDGSTLTIVITNDEQIRSLNLQYRSIDAPTDVLSFPADPVPIEETPYLGDLIIAYPYAKAQAEREGHSLPDSLTLLVVHGTLHLLGYDHDTPENRAEMWDEQYASLRALGIDASLVPALEEPDDAS